MHLFGPKTITTSCSLDEVNYRLDLTDKFEGVINKENFEIREKVFFHNRFLFPVIKGLINECGKNTKIFLVFELSKTDKIGSCVYFTLILFFWIFMIFYSRDVLISLFLILWIALLFFYDCVVYRIQCRRALRKIKKLLHVKR